MKIGYHTITWGGVVGDPVGVTSVKNLFYRVNGDMKQAIADIAAEGYQGVEMFDGNVNDFADDPDELRQELRDHGQRLVGVYTGANFVFDEIIEDEMWRVSKAIDLAATFDAQSIVVGGGAQRFDGTHGDDYRRLGSALDRVCDLADEQGLQACFHPHLSTIVENPEQIAQLFEQTRIGFCPDTAHLYAGGGDPAALIRAYPDRIRHVHLKDYNSAEGIFEPIGNGVIDFDDVMAAIREVDYDGWLVVELDEYAGDPRDAARISKTAVDALLAAHPS